MRQKRSLGPRSRWSFIEYLARERNTLLAVRCTVAAGASHAAKGARGEHRRRLRDIKCAAVSWVIERAPDAVRLTDLGLDLVGVAFAAAPVRLHTPIRALTPAARRVVLRLVAVRFGEHNVE